MSSTMPADEYALAHTPHDQELARLQALEAAVDRDTFAALDRVPIAAGWSCLDVGAGAGSVARDLRRRVGPTGRVVAADLDTRFLTDERAAGLEVVSVDVRTDDLGSAEFDLVHCRALLEHLADPLDVLRGIARAVKPGGWILVEDVDFLTLALPADGSEQRRCAHETLTRMFDFVQRAGFMRPSMGRELVVLARSAGVVDIECEAVARYAVPGDDRSPILGLLGALAPVAIDAGVVTAAAASEAFEVLSAPDTPLLSPMLFCLRGRRPPA